MRQLLGNTRWALPVREFFAERGRRPREDEQGGQQPEVVLEVVEAARILFSAAEVIRDRHMSATWTSDHAAATSASSRRGTADRFGGGRAMQVLLAGRSVGSSNQRPAMEPFIIQP